MRCTNYNPPKTNGFAIYLRAPGTIILNDMFFCAEIFGDIFPKTGLLILWKIQWTKKLVDFTYELNSRLLQSSIGESYGILLGWPIIRRNKGKHLAVELNSWISLLISKVVCFGLYGTRWPSCNQLGNQHVGCQRIPWGHATVAFLHSGACNIFIVADAARTSAYQEDLSASGGCKF